jgi:hypothetical protein
VTDIEHETGRIHQIINSLIKKHDYKSILEISTVDKLDALCQNLQLDYNEFDDLIINNSPVLRTVAGHVFETFFDLLLKKNGYEVQVLGGDSPIDRVVNGHTLQLKTPNKSGTKDNIVQYKTHKTHGAKSENESYDYYHSIAKFADFLVGLISYNPLNILILHKKELPIFPKSKSHILSPFSMDWKNHLGLNAFDRIGVTLKNTDEFFLPSNNELLPKLSKYLNLSTEVIIDTILTKENFRIWVSIRGFARQQAFEKYAASILLDILNPSVTNRPRSDKADHAIYINGKYIYFQMKGVSINNCSFNKDNLTVGVETQLTRGRVNDHLTQSRLYFLTDFDYLIIALDPIIAKLYRKIAGLHAEEAAWEFYLISVNLLKVHPKFNNRINPLQKIKYFELEQHRFDEKSLNRLK